jgi:hypothetical protein
MYVMWNLENSLHNLHYVDLTLDSYGIFKINEGQFHIIMRWLLRLVKRELCARGGGATLEKQNNVSEKTADYEIR